MSPHLPENVKLRSVTVLIVLSAFVAASAVFMWTKEDDDVLITPTPVVKEVARLPALRGTDIDARLTYSLNDAAATKRVPAVLLTRIDKDLDRIADVDEKKTTFFRIMLPLVAQANDRIRAERQKIVQDPEGVPASLYRKYDVDNGDVATLLNHVDIVPASLVIAQAALESGWGTSRFARHGNNLFGMRTYDPDAPGIVPEEADGFKVMTFKSLGHAVRTYITNLNTHNAYRNFRKERATLRASGGPIGGMTLTHHLDAYSEIPEKYGKRLRAMMTANDLLRFDGIRLAQN